MTRRASLGMSVSYTRRLTGDCDFFYLATGCGAGGTDSEPTGTRATRARRQGRRATRARRRGRRATRARRRGRRATRARRRGTRSTPRATRARRRGTRAGRLSSVTKKQATQETSLVIHLMRDSNPQSRPPPCRTLRFAWRPVGSSGLHRHTNPLPSWPPGTARCVVLWSAADDNVCAEGTDLRYTSCPLRPNGADWIDASTFHKGEIMVGLGLVDM